jgi:hypothetical protein
MLRTILGGQVRGFGVFDSACHLFPTSTGFGLLGLVIGLSPGALDLSLEVRDLCPRVYELLLHPGEELVDILRDLVAMELAIEVLDRLAECGTEVVEHACAPFSSGTARYAARKNSGRDGAGSSRYRDSLP